MRVRTARLQTPAGAPAVSVTGLVLLTLLSLLVAGLGTGPATPRAGDRVTLAHAVARQPGEPRAWALGATSSARGRVRPLPIGVGWGPSRREIDRAGRLVAGMSLAERAGQVIVAHYTGTAPPVDLVRDLHLGGIVVFDANVTSAAQLRASNRSVQRAARAAGRPFGVTVAVDQEGGLVERVRTGTRFPAFMTAGAAAAPASTRAAARASGAELAALGFTTDYAPVADVTVGRADPVIGARAAGSDPRVVTTHALAAARGLASTGVVPVLKHFPGHGSVTADSHLTLPRQERSVETLRKVDLAPFRAGVRAGLPSVMVGHLDVRAVDPGVPSSLSRPVVHGLLRGRLGFDGLVVTDALNMGAVTRTHDSGRSAVQALRAGVDVLLMPPSAEQARDAVVRAVREGRLDSRRLVQAATRQVALLLHQRARGFDGSPPGAAGALSARWSAAALTSVDGPCSGRMVGPRVQVTGDADAVRTFRAAGAAAGLEVVAPRSGGRGEGERRPGRAERRQQPADVTTVRLLGYGDPPARGDVVVALDAPHVLGASRAAVARLATYGQTYGAMSALVDVLLGVRTAPGRLPVAVPGVPRAGC